MTFDDIILESEYDSINNDVYDEFFNKVLNHSVMYNRIGGKFTSKNFALCAEGLQEFIQKDGKMKLVLMPEFTQEDIDSINRGVKNAHDVISECWIKDFTNVKEKFTQDHTKALAWMLAHDYLEIKIVMPVDDMGSILPGIKLEDSNLFKHSTGVFWDQNNKTVSFSGDVDFEDKVFGEYHRFRVYRGWDDSERKYLEKDYEEFYRYWDGDTIDADVHLKAIELPDAIKNRLVEIAPKSKSEIKLQNMPRLRPYQKTAVKKWMENDGRGIFEMATGTGKTFTAIACIDEIKKKHKPLMVVVVCPYDNLERQWKKELAKWGFDSIITSGNPGWARDMDDRLVSLERSNDMDISIIITVYNTFCTEKFVDIVEKSNVSLLLISDEVHNAGAATASKGLTNAYNYRLGLSATLERYFDPDGTQMLQKFFGNTVYTLDLAHAIEKGFLVGYNYYPVFVDLNEEEYEEYRRHTRTIARLWSSKDPEDRYRLEKTLLKRSKIVRDAANKLEEFKKWIDANGENVRYALIYCSENQMPAVKKTLNCVGIVNHEITAHNPSDPAQRMEIIKKFEGDLYNAIVANRVLDEGADIPSAKNCIMLASTGNPKQFIQRRGRVLRRFSGTYPDGTKKEHAEIHDILIIPEISQDYTDEEIRTERQIVKSQLRRLEDMASIAINRDSCMNTINEIKKKFGIEE